VYAFTSWVTTWCPARNPRWPRPVRVLPERHKIIEAQQSGKTLGRGVDFALVVLVFLGIGYVLDRVLDTRPLFVIILVVFGFVGQFVKMYYEYTHTMTQLEAERAARKVPRRASEEASS
jgi:F0F1-type ATP synthase assembly protein I